jgi:hypothetical protein
MQFRMLFQDLWVSDIDWDTPVMPEIKREWEKQLNLLKNLKVCRVPRLLLLVELYKDIKQLLQHCEITFMTYTDSMVVLNWVRQ